MRNLIIEAWDATGGAEQCLELPADVSGRERQVPPHLGAVAAGDHASRRLRHHRSILAIACAVGVLAFVLQERPDGRVAFRGLMQIPLPQACFARTWLRLRCPGCGLTRSIIHLAEGDWAASWRSHRVGGVVAVLIALQVPYRLLAMRQPDVPLIVPRWQAVLAYALIALLLGNWMLELAAGRLASV